MFCLLTVFAKGRKWNSGDFVMKLEWVSDKDSDMAAKYFERATQLDPSYALAWVGLSRARK
jgi:hypothetical protein